MSGDYPQPRRARHPATPTVGVSVVTCDSPREHRQLRADEITTAMGRGLPQRGGEEARS